MKPYLGTTNSCPKNQPTLRGVVTRLFFWHGLSRAEDAERFEQYLILVKNFMQRKESVKRKKSAISMLCIPVQQAVNLMSCYRFRRRRKTTSMLRPCGFLTQNKTCIYINDYVIIPIESLGFSSYNVTLLHHSLFF